MSLGGSKPVSGLTGPQKEVGWFLEQYLNQNVFGEGGKKLIAGAKPFPGQYPTTGLLPGWNQVYDLLGKVGKTAGVSPYSPEGENALRDLLSGKPTQQISAQQTQDWFEKAVQAPAMLGFKKDILPQINEAFAGVSGFSSRQGVAVADAASRLSTQLAGDLANTQYQNVQLNAQLKESAAQRQIAGLGADLAGKQFSQQAMLQQALLPIQQAQGAASILGPLQSRLDTQDLGAFNFQYQDWLRTQPENNPYLQLALAFTGTNSAFLQQNPNRVGGALGGAIGGAQAGNMLWPGWGALIGGLLGGGAGYFGAGG